MDLSGLLSSHATGGLQRISQGFWVSHPLPTRSRNGLWPLIQIHLNLVPKRTARIMIRANLPIRRTRDALTSGFWTISSCEV
jgi:hypothetical protein